MYSGDQQRGRELDDIVAYVTNLCAVRSLDFQRHVWVPSIYGLRVYEYRKRGWCYLDWIAAIVCHNS